jgi:hypothetical protein
LVPISVTYLRLDDSRAGVLVFPIVALALWLTIEPFGTSQLRRVLVLGGAIGAAMLVHPLIGIYAAGFLAVGAVLRPPWHAGHVWPALAVGATLALPQAAATAGLAIPAWLAILPIPLAVGVGFVAVEISRRLPVLEKRVAPVLVGALLIGGLAFAVVVAPTHLRVAWTQLWRDNGYIVTVAAALLAVLAWRRRGIELFPAAVITAIAVAIGTATVPHQSGLALSVFQEAPKYVYIVPTLLTIAGAVGLAALWASPRIPLGVRAGLTALILAAAAIPLNDPVLSEFSLGEHGWSEGTSIALRGAGRGGFPNFPDSRQLINAEQEELVARLRQEIDAGRLGPDTPVLEVAWSFRLWAATPMAVFTGAMVSTATPNPERSSHTVGGRLHDIGELGKLVGPAFPYVVYEPASMDPAIRDTIVNAGYTPIFANDRGEIFAWHQPGG